MTALTTQLDVDACGGSDHAAMQSRGRVAARLAPRAVRFGLGPLDVEVTCPREAVIADLRTFYGPAADDGRPVIHITARPEPLRPWRYRIEGDAAPMFHRVPRCELLPYIEWAINGRVADRCRRFLLLHAATLSWRGKGVVFAAASGSGKSTLAATLLARGWQYLCDEFALIDLRTRQLHALPRAICVKAGSFPAIERLGLPLRRDHHHVKAFKGEVGYIAPRDLGRDAVAPGPVPVSAVVLPQYLPGASLELAPIPRADAAMQLAGHAFNRQWLGHRATALLGEVCAHADCLRLTHSDGQAAGAALERLLAA